jgi:hypothetical protein
MPAWVLREAPKYFTKFKVPFIEVDNAIDGIVHEGPDWQFRSRSSGDFFNGTPLGIVVHHTASPTSQSIGSALRYEIHTADAEPIGNFTIARDGVWHITCAGASNTNGVGGPWLTSNGVIAQDTGNTRLIGVEAMNNGIGETWTPEMQITYPLGVAALCDLINNECQLPNKLFTAGKDVMAHFEWGNVTIPNRKNDPFGPSPWNDFTNTRWNMDRFRGTVFGLLLPPVEELIMDAEVKAAFDKINVEVAATKADLSEFHEHFMNFTTNEFKRDQAELERDRKEYRKFREALQAFAKVFVETT